MRMLNLRDNVISIIITYNPDISSGILEKQITILEKHCLRIVLIDNDSKNKKNIANLCSNFKKTDLVQLDKNYGIGYALNIGLEIAIKTRGARWLLTLDQDSLFDENTFENAEKEMSSFSIKSNLACFGVNFTDLHFKKIKKQNNSGKPVLVKALITSGCFMRIDIVKDFRFKSELFMYSIDTDFSYKLRKAGFDLLLLYEAKMDHKGGKRKSLNNGEEVHFNDTLALYYMSRNSIYLLRKYHDLNSFLYVLYLYLENVFANEKPILSALNMIKGYLDGLTIT